MTNPPAVKSLLDKLMPEPRYRKMRAFLGAYARTGIVLDGCRAADITRGTFYYWLRESMEEPPNPAFCLQIEDGEAPVPLATLAKEASEIATDAAEAEVRRRAVDGYDEPVFYQGQQVASIRKWSDLLLMFYVKRHRPEFRDNYKVEVEHSGTVEVESARDRLAAKLEMMLGAGTVIDAEPVRKSLIPKDGPEGAVPVPVTQACGTEDAGENPKDSGDDEP